MKKGVKEAQTALDRALAKAVAEFANTVTVPCRGGWVARNGDASLFGMFQKVLPQVCYASSCLNNVLNNHPTSDPACSVP